CQRDRRQRRHVWPMARSSDQQPTDRFPPAVESGSLHLDHHAASVTAETMKPPFEGKQSRRQRSPACDKAAPDEEGRPPKTEVEPPDLETSLKPYRSHAADLRWHELEIRNVDIAEPAPARFPKADTAQSLPPVDRLP